MINKGINHDIDLTCLFDNYQYNILEYLFYFVVCIYFYISFVAFFFQHIYSIHKRRKKNKTNEKMQEENNNNNNKNVLQTGMLKCV